MLILVSLPLPKDPFHKKLVEFEKGPSDQLIWVLLSYILAESVTFTVIGQLTDIFGRRWYYIGGSILSVIGGIICCRATSINTIIGGVGLLSLLQISAIN